MKHKLSVVTVSYNSMPTIEQTIQSVLSQSYENFEYILIDGASTDGTKELIQNYAQKDDRIKFLSEPDNGIYDAMNKGIRMATGDAIALLNSDDYYEPDALSIIAEHIPRRNKYVVYGMVRLLKSENEDSVLLINHEALPNKMMMHPACFVSRDIYEQYQYDTEYKSAADYDLFLRLYQDKNISFIPVYNIITNFRMGGMSSSSVGFAESLNIRRKYNCISKKQYYISKAALLFKKIMN